MKVDAPIKMSASYADSSYYFKHMIGCPRGLKAEDVHGMIVEYVSTTLRGWQQSKAKTKPTEYRVQTALMAHYGDGRRAERVDGFAKFWSVESAVQHVAGRSTVFLRELIAIGTDDV